MIIEYNFCHHYLRAKRDQPEVEEMMTIKSGDE